MSSKTPRLYITDIKEAINSIEEYIQDLSFEDFKKDRKTIDAVIRNFEIMGEAANRLPEDFKEEHSRIPRSKIIGVRNKVIHEYFGIDLEIIWKTMQEDLPELKAALASF